LATKQYNAVHAASTGGLGRNLLEEQSCQTSPRSDVKRRTFLKSVVKQEAQEQEEEQQQNE